MIRRWTGLLLAAVLLLGSVGCAAAEEPDVSLYELQKAMLAADETLPEMDVASSRDDTPEALFSYLSDLDYERVDGFFLAYSRQGLADEVAVVRVKDAADTAAAAESLERHLEGRQQLYRQYEPEQAARAEKGQVFTHGRYAVLLICDGADAVRAAFDGML